MKLGEVKGTLDGLLQIAGKNLPVKVSYAIAKNIKVLNEEFKTIEEQRIKLCEKYAKKDDTDKPITIEKNGNQVYQFDDNDEQKVNEEYAELLEEETKLDIHKVNIHEFEKCDQSDRYDILNASEYSALEFMID